MSSTRQKKREPLASIVGVPGWFIATPWRYVGLLITLVLSQWALFRADLVFLGISGFPTLDTQNDLTAQDALEQIRSYSRDSVQAYELFAVIDYVFPLVASLFLSATVLWLLRQANRSTRWRIPEWISLLCLLPALFDYVENIFLAGAVATDGGSTFIAVALVAKALKLTSLALTSGLLAMSLVYTAVALLLRRMRGR